MTVLILGFPQDIHIHAVRWALDQIGVGNHVLYTPDMPNVLRALWVEQDEPGCPMLRAFTSLLIQHRLDRSSPLVGSDRISFGAFLESGAWERGCADDYAHHTRYDALRAVNEP